MSVHSIDDSLYSTALRNHVGDVFSPANLFIFYLSDLLLVWTEQRNFLEARGALLQQHSSRRILLGLTHRIYVDTEVETVAIELANRIVATSRQTASEISVSKTLSTNSGEAFLTGRYSLSEERTA